MKKYTFRLLAVISMMLVLAPAANAYKMRIMSFNIRLYNTKADAPHNLWEQRRDPLCAYIGKVNPDVFGCQEVVANQLTDILARLPQYGYLGVGRDDGKTKGEYSPIFYLKDKFEVVRSGHFWLSETPNEPSYGWGAACRRVVTWAVLKDKKKGKEFFYCNTHFDHKSMPARREGAKLIKDFMNREASTRMPAFFTADCNVNETNEAYKTMCEYHFPFADTWHTAKKTKGGPASFHGWGQRPNNANYKIDFIFCSPSVKVSKAEIHDSSIDGTHFLSDHNALWADVSWK